MYYVLYEEYSEYNQFEGSWDKDWKSFNTEKEAIDYVLSIQKNHNYHNVIGPLKTIY